MTELEIRRLLDCHMCYITNCQREAVGTIEFPNRTTRYFGSQVWLARIPYCERHLQHKLRDARAAETPAFIERFADAQADRS